MKKDRKKSKLQENKLPVKQLQQAILRLFKQNPDKKYSIRHIIEKLGIGNNKDSVQYALDQLESSGQLKAIQAAQITGANIETAITSDEPFVPKANPLVRANRNSSSDSKVSTSDDSKGDIRKIRPQNGTYIGTVDVTRTGAAYIVCEGLENDVYVNAKSLNGALHGDKVKIAAYFQNRRRPDGEVLQVLERATDHFIGTFMHNRHFAIVAPDRMGMPDIFIEDVDTKGAKDGEKVTVRVTKWLTRANKKLTGVVTSVLGQPGTSDIEMKSILINTGFNIEFPEDVLAETAKIKDDIASEVSKRRDFRDITTFTIDPHDAKDFDDALSYRILENGNTEVGIHIADVTHYILPDTALDKEAYLRSTSVYLVDRVCPMLPEKLSNELCSLRPNEDKLTFSAVFTFNEKNEIVEKWFGKTIIHSDRRFAYEEAQLILEAGEGDFVDELIKLNQIAYHLRKKRFKNGAINFETEEVKFRLDEHGVPIEVYVKERKDTNLLIEDFMLLANKEVATYMAKKDPSVEIPYIYRIHDVPNMDKLENFALFAREMGVKMNLDTPKNIAKSFDDLIKKAEKDENLKILIPIAIRTMAKAEYSSYNIGHYGLAFEYYSHFTSPIRRYSDVLAHRILFENLTQIKRFDKERLEDQCKYISKQERKAADAERESIKYKQVEYMKNHVGEEFDGIVSGMLERGIFVEIKGMMAEGMVPFERMSESFEVESSRLRAKGTRTGKIYKMGDSVRVRILKADMEKKQIEMGLADS
jgi:ribonuclease R